MSHAAWHAAGFLEILPIIPPGARLAPTFSRTKEVGKMPGRKNQHGEWAGLAGWTNAAPRPALWDGWGASVGLRTRHFPAVDIDCTDSDLADRIEEWVRDALGPAPTRTGQAPKRTLLYRTSVPFKRLRLWIETGNAHHLVEILGDGQQLVVEGTHPGTGQPFTWTPGPPAAPDVLTSITVADADGLLDALAARLTEAGHSCSREGAARAAGAPVAPQARLAGPQEEVRRLVPSIPNDNLLFPGRDDYLRMGYAIKAAMPEHPEEAFGLWWEWCARWEGNARVKGNTAAEARADWDRMVPPYQVGIEWLRERAPKDPQEDFSGPGIPTPETPEPEGTPNVGGEPVPFSDWWLARRVLDALCDTLRHCSPLGGWHLWNGCRWVLDVTGEAREMIGAEMVNLGRQAKVKEGPRIRQYVASRRGRENVPTVAATDPRVSRVPSDFDADPWVLNTPGGMYDLRTGARLPADPARHFTRATAVAPEPGPPAQWLQFLREVTAGDEDLASYLQRLAGYCLTGVTHEHMFAFLWGPGGNGKGVFLNTLVRLWGNYAQVSAMDSFASSNYDKHPTDLAQLAGARLVTAQETRVGRQWDEARIKATTAGDPISARFMRQDAFIYVPQFKLLFAGNHRPRVHVDEAMRRRMHLIPFTFRPKEPDTALSDRLMAEGPRILQWAVEGCTLWQQRGLLPPASVLAATGDYFTSEDRIGGWMAERTRPEPRGTADLVTLFADWVMWCGEQGERPGRLQDLAAGLVVRGVAKTFDSRTRRAIFHGLALTGSDFS